MSGSKFKTTSLITEIDTGKPGYFTRYMAHLIEVDNLSAALYHSSG